MVVFDKVINNAQRDLVVSLANTIWHEAYQDLLSKEQRDYMLETFQSLEAIRNSELDYYLIYYNNTICGYLGLGQEDHCLLLSKIYLLDVFRGKGILDSILDFSKECAKEKSLNTLRLYVNKYNKALARYEAKGFKIVSSHVFDIGNDYVMDDYRMELPIL